MKKTITLLICVLFLIGTLPFSFASDKYALKYDENGNLIQDLEHYYKYDSFNQLVKISDLEGNVVARYYYDEAGQRIKSVVAGKTTYYVNRNYIKDGGKDIIYYYDSSSLVGKKEDGKLYYYHTDFLGSVDLVTDSSKRIVEDIDYTPFGESEGESRYQFTGQEKDEESDLMYYNARYYSPFLMHFTQPDTMLPNVYDPQQLNRYSYARNNPMKYKDDSGHWIHIALGAAIGGLIGGGVNLVSQIWSGRSMFDGSVSWGEVGKSAAIGAGAGAVGAATFGIVGGAVGVSSFSGSVSTGAASVMMAGRGAQLASNVVSGNSLTSGMLDVSSMARDAVIGGVTGGVLYGAGKTISAIKNSGRSLTSNKPSSLTVGGSKGSQVKQRFFNGKNVPKPVYNSQSDGHIKANHHNLNNAAGKSKFIRGEGGQAFANEVYSKGKIMMQNDGRFRIEANLGRVAGTRGETAGRVILQPDGVVKTQFPQKKVII